MKKIISVFVVTLMFLSVQAQTFQWANSIGGGGADIAQHLVLDSNDNIYSGGLFRDTVDFNPGLASTIFSNYGAPDIYVAKSDNMGNLLWARQYSSSPLESLNIAIDNNEDLGICGYWRGTTMDASPTGGWKYLTGPGFNNGPHIFQIGITANGRYNGRLKHIGATSNTTKEQGKGYGLAFDRFKGRYTTGYFRGTFEFGYSSNPIQLSTPMPSYPRNMYLYRQDSSGNIWAIKLGSTSQHSEGRSVTTDSNANCYLTGVFRGSIDFNPDYWVSDYLSGSNDVPVAKYDTALNYKWARRCVSGSGFNVGNDIKLDSKENVYVVGTFNGTADFDPGSGIHELVTSAPNVSDAYVFKLDTAGNFLWAKQIGGDMDDEGRKIAIDSADNVYVLGTFRDTVNFDTDSGNYYYLGTPNAPSYNVFVSKYLPDGTFQWTKSIEGPQDVRAGSIAIGKDNSIYMNGYFLDTIDADPSATTHWLQSHGDADIFTLKLSDCGLHYSTQNLSACDSITVDTTTYYHSGYYTHLYNTVDGCDSNMVYNISLGHTTQSNLIVAACDSFVFNSQTLYNTGIYYDTLLNASNCDSIITLNLTITQSNGSVIIQTGCDSLTINGQVYTSSGTYAQTFTNTQSCDSIVTLNLTINNSTTNTITQTGCDSLTINGQTYVSSGTFTQLFTNSQGCDSTLSLNLIVNNSTSSIISQTGCDSLIINGQTYSNSGVYSQVFTNANGCDSIVSLNLTIDNSTSDTISQTVCDSLTVNGQTYTSSGTYNQVLTNSNNCDSNLVIILTINNSTSNIITQTSCSPITINSQTYSTTGTYYQTLTNAQGCDSNLTLNLTINTVNASASQNGLVLSAAPSGATYKWIKCNPYSLMTSATGQTYSVTSNGDYAVIVTLNGCSDTSNCLIINNVGIEDYQKNRITIFPNPTNDKLQIQLYKIEQEFTIEILTLEGKKLFFQKNGKVKKATVDISKLAAGLYLVKIQTPTWIGIQKLEKR